MATVSYYISPRGDNPVRDFIDSHTISKPAAMRTIRLIQEYGLQAAIPHTKKLTGTPLWEIRILGQESIRIIYVCKSPWGVLLLHAFEKKTQKTPPQEIHIALGRLQRLGG